MWSEIDAGISMSRTPGQAFATASTAEGMEPRRAHRGDELLDALAPGSQASSTLIAKSVPGPAARACRERVDEDPRLEVLVERLRRFSSVTTRAEGLVGRVDAGRLDRLLAETWTGSARRSARRRARAAMFVK